MKKVLFFLLVFVIIGVYENRVDSWLKPYTATPLEVVPKEQTTYNPLESIKKARESNATTAARSKARFEDPKSESAIAAYQEYLKDVVPDNEESCYFNIIDKESKWDPYAQNPRSTAFGIGQFLNSTWGLVDAEKTKNPYNQIDAMVQYVKLIYGNGCNAWHFRLKHGWY